MTEEYIVPTKTDGRVVIVGEVAEDTIANWMLESAKLASLYCCTIKNKTHSLKTHPKYFSDVSLGLKPFDVRKADRDFVIGDAMILKEYDPDTEQYTGREVVVVISYIMTDPSYVKEGFVILGIVKIA
jgi:hypothetical protein